jgi:hypothetical protein
MSSRNVLLGGLLAGLVVLAGAAGGGDKSNKKYDSPKAVFEAAVNAVKKKDWKTFYACLTKDGQETMTGQVAFVGLMVRGFAEFDKTGKTKEKMAPLTKILDKHGLTTETLDKMKKEAPKPSKDPKEMAKAFRALAAPVKNKAGFISEVLEFLDKASTKKQQNPLENATLKDVKVDGDRATATVVTKKGDEKTEEKITFVKTGGSWKMDMPLPSPKAGKSEK